MSEAPPPLRDGRSFGWRLAALGLGVLFGGAGFVLVVKPELLAYGVAVLLGIVAVLSILAALLSR